jgi:DNA repair exonuclease SbcCD ATPase subunit
MLYQSRDRPDIFILGRRLHFDKISIRTLARGKLMMRLMVAHLSRVLLLQIHSLSGGQLSLVGFTLAMAIQDCYPSRFYVLDEIDASMDAHTVVRVGQFLRNRSSTSTQIICVSHRPELQLSATELLGLYNCNCKPNHILCRWNTNVD